MLDNVVFELIINLLDHVGVLMLFREIISRSYERTRLLQNGLDRRNSPYSSLQLLSINSSLNIRLQKIKPFKSNNFAIISKMFIFNETLGLNDKDIVEKLKMTFSE